MGRMKEEYIRLQNEVEEPNSDSVEDIEARAIKKIGEDEKMKHYLKICLKEVPYPYES